METTRLEALSDGVFAFALTVLVLTIAVPPVGSSIGAGLLELWPSYLTYAVSFLLIGAIWVNHEAMFRHIVRADQTLLLLNLLHLMHVAFVPFPTAILAAAFIRGTDQAAAAAFYGGTFAFGPVIVNLMWRYAARGRRLLRDDLTPEKTAQLNRRYMVGLLAYPLAMIVGILLPSIALVMFVAITVFYIWPRRAQRPLAPVPAAGARGKG